MIHSDNVDFNAVMQTWLKSSVPVDVFRLVEYNGIHRHTNQMRGGILIYVRNYFNIPLRNKLNDLQFIEVLWCWVEYYESTLRVLY